MSKKKISSKEKSETKEEPDLKEQKIAYLEEELRIADAKKMLRSTSEYRYQILLQGVRIENALNGIGKVLSKIGETLENKEEAEEESEEEEEEQDEEE